MKSITKAIYYFCSAEYRARVIELYSRKKEVKLLERRIIT